MSYMHNRQIFGFVDYIDSTMPYSNNLSIIENQNHDVLEALHNNQTLNQDLTPEEITLPPFIRVDEIESNAYPEVELVISPQQQREENALAFPSQLQPEEVLLYSPPSPTSDDINSLTNSPFIEEEEDNTQQSPLLNIPEQQLQQSLTIPSINNSNSSDNLLNHPQLPQQDNTLMNLTEIENAPPLPTSDEINSLTNSPFTEEEEDNTQQSALLNIPEQQLQQSDGFNNLNISIKMSNSSQLLPQQQSSVLSSEYIILSTSTAPIINLPDIAQPPPLPNSGQQQSQETYTVSQLQPQQSQQSLTMLNTSNISLNMFHSPQLQMHQAEVKQQQSRLNGNNNEEVSKKGRERPRNSDKNILEDGKTKRKNLSSANSNKPKKKKKSDEEIFTVSSTAASLNLLVQSNPNASESIHYATTTSGSEKNNAECNPLRNEKQLTNSTTEENVNNRRFINYVCEHLIEDPKDKDELRRKKIYKGEEITKDDIRKREAYKNGSTESDMCICHYCDKTVSKYWVTLYKNEIICFNCGCKGIYDGTILATTEFFEYNDREKFEGEEKCRLCGRLKKHYAPFYQFIEFKDGKNKVLKTCRYCRQIKQYEYAFKLKKKNKRHKELDIYI